MLFELLKEGDQTSSRKTYLTLCDFRAKLEPKVEMKESWVKELVLLILLDLYIIKSGISAFTVLSD